MPKFLQDNGFLSDILDVFLDNVLNFFFATFSLKLCEKAVFLSDATKTEKKKQERTRRKGEKYSAFVDSLQVFLKAQRNSNTVFKYSLFSFIYTFFFFRYNIFIYIKYILECPYSIYKGISISFVPICIDNMMVLTRYV